MLFSGRDDFSDYQLFFLRPILVVLAFLITSTAFAQKNIVKGRAIYLPFNSPKYSFGLGYERIVSEKISVQLLYNNSRSDIPIDAPTTESQGFVPEVRYYLGKNSDVRKKWFLGVFSELYKVRIYGGRPSYYMDSYLVETNGNTTTFGVLLGKNFSIGQRFLLDAYIGYRHIKLKGHDTYRNVTTSELYTKDRIDSGSGIRGGVNLGFTF